MVEASVQAVFERMAVSGAGDGGALAAGLRRQITTLGLRALSAKMLHVAVSAPTRMADVYDNAANGWLSGPVFAPNFRGVDEIKPPKAFWQAFWRLVETPTAKRRRTSFTVETMRLAGLLSPKLTARVAEAAAEVPGVLEAAARGAPPPLRYSQLAAYPASTLGAAIHREMMSRGQLREIVEPDILGLAALPAPLEFVNTELLRRHMLWAALCGYSATPLDEIGLAAFQMGQFRHHHGALIVGLSMATVALERPPGLEIVLDTIFRGWVHGRETPLLLGIDWEDMLPLPLEAVRERLGVTPFASPWTAAIKAWAEANARGD